MEVRTKNYSASWDNKVSDYDGHCGVWIFENDELYLHIDISYIPTEKEMLSCLLVYQDYYDNPKTDKEELLDLAKEISNKEK